MDEQTIGDTPSDDLKAWLGDNFGGWIPGGVTIKFADGGEFPATTGDKLRRLEDGGIEIWHA